jgi:MFS family permease
MEPSTAAFVHPAFSAADDEATRANLGSSASASASSATARTDLGAPASNSTPTAAAGESHGAYFAESFRVLKKYGLSFQLPNFLTGVGSAMYTALVPVICRQVIHVSDSQSGTILSMSGIGRMVGDAPASALSHALGPHTTIYICTFLYGCCMIFPAADMALWALMVSSFLQGVSAAGAQTPRSELIQVMIPKKIRSRLTSHIGGIGRLSYIVGPAIAGLIYQHISVRAVFYFSIPMFVISSVCIFASGDMRAAQVKLLAQKEEEERAAEAASIAATGAVAPKPNPVVASVTRLVNVFREHHSIVVRVGIFHASIFALRNCRRFLLSLAALNLNLSARNTMFVVSGSYAVDAFLFWVGAAINDRYGRNFAAVPLCVLMAGAFFILSFVDHLSVLIISAILFGFADCFGAGLLLAITAESVPRKAIGLTRLIQDSGQLLGPLIAGFLAHHVSLRASCLVMAAWSGVATLWAVFVLPPPLPPTLLAAAGAKGGDAGRAAAASPTTATEATPVGAPAVHPVPPAHGQPDPQATASSDATTVVIPWATEPPRRVAADINGDDNDLGQSLLGK